MIASSTLMRKIGDAEVSVIGYGAMDIAATTADWRYVTLFLLHTASLLVTIYPRHGSSSTNCTSQAATTEIQQMVMVTQVSQPICSCISNVFVPTCAVFAIS